MLKGSSLFKQTRILENKINEFFVNILQAGQYFEKAFTIYLKSGVTDEFMENVNTVSLLESKNDLLRREMEQIIYGQLILPDMQSDILKILEGIDKIINKYESDLLLLSVEHPKILSGIIPKLETLIHLTTECVKSLIEGAKCFFACKSLDNIFEDVRLLEHQIDLVALRLKRKVFEDMTIDLAHKLQHKEYIYYIEKISDMAEDISDSITIMAIKHRI